MRHTIRRLASFILSGATSLAFAGEAPASGLVDGYFLGFNGFAYVAGDDGPDRDKLLSICKARGRLWALGVDAPLKCVAARRLENNIEGMGPIHELKIHSDKSIETSHALLYSVRPFAKASWAKRALTESESQELNTAAGLKPKKYRSVLAHIKQGHATVIEPGTGKLNIFILPWKITNDGVVDDKDYLIAVRHSPGKFSFKEQRGTIIGYADMDGDGVPEIQNSMNCDGTCESVISVTRQFSEMLSIYEH